MNMTVAYAIPASGVRLLPSRVHDQAGLPSCRHEAGRCVFRAYFWRPRWI